MTTPLGLRYVPNIISSENENKLLEFIDSQTWNTSITRRTQHYGYEYSYSSKHIDKSKYTSMPSILQELCIWLKDQDIFQTIPDQCIVNEYTRNQGISPHIDQPNNFGPVIASISLGSNTIMDFTNNNLKFSQFLERGSLVVLKEDSRYKWKHGISSNVSYISPETGLKIIKPENYRRISLTFRTVI